MKLQQTDQYLLLIDEEAEIKSFPYFLWKDEVHKFHSDNGYGIKTWTGYNDEDGSSEIVNWSNKWKGSVIAYYPLQENSPKLDLPLLPNPFKNNIDIEALQEGLKEYPYRDINNDLALGGYIRGYKAAQKKFSKEDMIKAFEEGMKWYKKRTTSILDVYNDFIQSLSTQQLPIIFEPEYETITEGTNEFDFYEKDVIKTIINSNGNKELVGKYK